MCREAAGKIAAVLKKATKIRIIDPNIRTDYQVQRLDDLVEAVAVPKGFTIELVTMFEKNEPIVITNNRHAIRRRSGISSSYNEPFLCDRLSNCSRICSPKLAGENPFCFSKWACMYNQ